MTLTRLTERLMATMAFGNTRTDTIQGFRPSRCCAVFRAHRMLRLVTLFDKERQILRLLHVDSLSSSPTWYLDACTQPETRATLKTRLFLSGYDLGFNLDTTTLQDTLDFGSREKELFSGADMGEDVRKLLADYLRLFSAIRQAVSA